MSQREKILVAVVLALFALAHIGGAFVLSGASRAQVPDPFQLVHHGD